MTKGHHILLFVLSLIICIRAAPSDVSRLEDITEIEKGDNEKSGQESDDVPITLTDDIKNDNTTQGLRQKRWYNFYGYGIPPMNPVIYPNYKRDESSETSVYGGEDPFGQIYRRLQEIARVARQPIVPPPPPQFPIFFPVIYIPFVSCACTPENTSSPPTTNQNNGTMPGISERFPEMEDPRQNWGVVVNDTEDNVEEDFSRPISFDPIRPNNTMTRPQPPVEHGSIQASANSQSNVQSQTTTVSSSEIEENLSASFDSPDTPSVCDGAVLSCCHQPQVTYDCFVSQGCPDPTSYGNPCEASVILRVVEKFQRFYGQRTG